MLDPELGADLPPHSSTECLCGAAGACYNGAPRGAQLPLVGGIERACADSQEAMIY